MREATRWQFLDFPPDSLLFLAIGGLSGADVLGEGRIRWVVYISSSNRVVLPRIRLDSLPVKILSVSFCPLQIFSSIACGLGELVLVLSEVLVVLDGHIFCVVFNIDEFVIVSIFCVGVGFPHVFPSAVGAHGASDSHSNTYVEKFWKV